VVSDHQARWKEEGSLPPTSPPKPVKPVAPSWTAPKPLETIEKIKAANRAFQQQEVEEELGEEIEFNTILPSAAPDTTSTSWNEPPLEAPESGFPTTTRDEDEVVLSALPTTPPAEAFPADEAEEEETVSEAVVLEKLKVLARQVDKELADELGEEPASEAVLDKAAIQMMEQALVGKELGLKARQAKPDHFKSFLDGLSQTSYEHGLDLTPSHFLHLMKVLQLQGAPPAPEEEKTPRIIFPEEDPVWEHQKTAFAPKSNSEYDLAYYLRRKLGIETYEYNTFWSRLSESEEYPEEVRHLIYEPVDKMEILRHLQFEVETMGKNINQDPLGKVPVHKYTAILQQLKINLSRAASQTFWEHKEEQQQSLDFGKSRLGVATSNGYFINFAQQPNGGWETVCEKLTYHHKQRFALTAAYDPEAKCPTFDKFLERSLAGLPDAKECELALKMWVAAAVLGQAPKIELGLYLHGRPRSGKSVFAEVVKSLFHKRSISYLGFSQFSSSDRFSVAKLLNSRLNVMTEVPQMNSHNRNQLFSAEKFKQAISGEEMFVEEKGKDGYNLTPRAAFLFCANHPVPLYDSSQSIFRRLYIIPFTNTVEKGKEDFNLKHKLRAELSGILNWVIEGALLLLNSERGTLQIPEPPSSLELKDRWLRNVDAVRLWVEEYCSYDPNLFNQYGRQPRGTFQKCRKLRDLHSAFKDWAEDQGDIGSGKITQNQFKTRLEDIGIPSKKTNAGMLYPIVPTKEAQLAIVAGGLNDD
jgi:P4 family phage/plasmid primase-like protien